MSQRLLLLDNGREWGGGTNSLLALLARLDRARHAVDAVFYHDYAGGPLGQLSRSLAALHVPLAIQPQSRQPLWAKLGKELARGVLTPLPGWRAAAVEHIELAWRVRPNAQQLAARLRQGGYQALYMNNQPQSNLEGYLAAQLAGVPVIQHCRSNPALSPRAVAAANQAARIIAVSHGIADSLRAQGVDPARIRVVPNGIDPTQPLPDPAACRARLGVSADTVVIGAVCSLLPRKGVADLLTAVARLQSATPLCVLVIGDGPQRAALEQQTHAAGLGECVRFVGFQAQVLEWTAALDICVLASASEGLPRVLLEAMLLGKPVVASRVTGSAELVVVALYWAVRLGLMQYSRSRWV
jgi:glycosyltransferase involved in cell wall biosynthesis